MTAADTSASPSGPQRHARRAGPSIGVLLLAWAVITELTKPKRKRKWHGKLLGVIPYDLRFPPSAKRLRNTFWNPRGPLFSPQAFGVGWTLNFGRLLKR